MKKKMKKKKAKLHSTEKTNKGHHSLFQTFLVWLSTTNKHKRKQNLGQIKMNFEISKKINKFYFDCKCGHIKFKAKKVKKQEFELNNSF